MINLFGKKTAIEALAQVKSELIESGIDPNQPIAAQISDLKKSVPPGASKPGEKNTEEGVVQTPVAGQPETNSAALLTEIQGLKDKISAQNAEIENLKNAGPILGEAGQTPETVEFKALSVKQRLTVVSQMLDPKN